MPLGVDDPIEALKDAVKQEAIKTAAVQTGISLALNLAGPIGMAASAILSVVNLFTGRLMKRKMADAQAEAEKKVKDHAAKRQRAYKARQSQVADEEMPAALALARSGAPLPTPAATPSPRLDGFFSDIGRGAKVVVKNVSRETVKSLKTVTGQSGVEELRDKLGDVVMKAQQQIDKQSAAETAKLDSPEYREELRLALAKQLRGQEPETQERIAASIGTPWVVGGVAVGAVAAGMLIYFLARRRKVR